MPAACQVRPRWSELRDMSKSFYLTTAIDYVNGQPHHKQVVQQILSQLHEKGHFYKSTYEGFYSAKEETFLTEKDRRADGTFDRMYGEVVRLQEENYYFKLKDHQQWLIDYLEQNP